MPFASASEAGLVRYVHGEWNDIFFAECEAFDGSRARKDDQVDAVADSFITLAQRQIIPNFSSGLLSANLTQPNPFLNAGA